MILVQMTHSEYVKFCKKIKNRYLFGLIICVAIAILGFSAFTYIGAPLMSYLILATSSVFTITNLGPSFIYWNGECRQ